MEEKDYFKDTKKGNCLSWALYYKLKHPTKIKLKIESGYWLKSLRKCLIPHVYWYDKRDGKYYHFRQISYLKQWYKFYYYKGHIDQQTFGKMTRDNL